MFGVQVLGQAFGVGIKTHQIVPPILGIMILPYVQVLAASMYCK